MAKFFISHSFKDGLKAARLIDDALSRSGEVAVWAPKRSMQLGRAWIDQVQDQLAIADAVILLMSRDSLKTDSACATECILAQRIGKPVIPVRVSKNVETYPRFVFPYNICLDAADLSVASVGSVVERIRSAGISGSGRVVDDSVWRLTESLPDSSALVGTWLFKRKLKPGERMALIPDYSCRMLPSNIYEAISRVPLGKLTRITGVWGYDSRHGHLHFASSAGKGSATQTMRIDLANGPNEFGGVTSDRRFMAFRLLELE